MEMKWIPIENFLPEEYEQVVISVYDKQLNLGGVNVAFYIDGKWYLRLGEEPIKLPVNAWMPLPEYYKGE